MNGTDIQEQTAQRALELPASELTHPFDEHWDVYKVRGKVFMLQTTLDGEPLTILKADPAESEALRATHRDVTPGYHMNKKHWITLRQGSDLEPEEVHELLTDSYRLVVAGLPVSQRPVDPRTFGYRR
ncbi:hypothetical protein KVA01_23340 [Kocuria varians]|uniref:DNA-binding protein n=1 Tax=Kocuria varians TaxID=1272 RepID=A0A4Y4D884_KOCVA|nr:MmcQ/YjbR family DNA-binding protein [Kocuria varians]GED00180.1 hypothetical protein KVA01_23340 [Kocuria varians]